MKAPFYFGDRFVFLGLAALVLAVHVMVAVMVAGSYRP
jgi:hypothetical protein